MSYRQSDPASREVVALDETRPACALGHEPLPVGVVLFDLAAPEIVQIVKPNISLARASFGYVTTTPTCQFTRRTASCMSCRSDTRIFIRSQRVHGNREASIPTSPPRRRCDQRLAVLLGVLRELNEFAKRCVLWVVGDLRHDERRQVGNLTLADDEQPA
jgi:hypothetical protein